MSGQLAGFTPAIRRQCVAKKLHTRTHGKPMPGIPWPREKTLRCYMCSIAPACGKLQAAATSGTDFELPSPPDALSIALRIPQSLVELGLVEKLLLLLAQLLVHGTLHEVNSEHSATG